MSATEESAADIERTRDTDTGTAADADTESVVEVDHRSSRLTRALSSVALVMGVALTALFALLAIPFAVAGLAISGGALFVRDSREWLSAGVGLVLVSQIIAGGFGAVPAELMLVGVSAAILGWDIGQFGIDLGQQLGRQTSTRQLELAHAAFTLSALTVADAIAYGVYSLSGTGRPASAVAIAILGLILFLWTGRR